MMPNPTENGSQRQQPSTSIWLTEPSAAAVEMGSLAGYDTVVLDIEHGLFDLGALDWIIPLIRAKGMRVIAKVLGPERGPIQQALDSVPTPSRSRTSRPPTTRPRSAASRSSRRWEIGPSPVAAPRPIGGSPTTG